MKKPLIKYNIVVKNDDVTPMDKVVWGLMQYAGISFEEATKLMMEIHYKGHSKVKVCHYELAETIMTKLSELGLEVCLVKEQI